MVTHDQRMTSSSTHEARHDAYDVVVLGAGMGGLTAGAVLARAGKRVLIVDANAQPGGYARSICRGAYTFDLADHLILSCAPAGPFGPGIIDTVLRHLGVRERCEFLRVEHPFYEARFPDFTLDVPCGREEYLDAHLRHFPGEAHGLRHLTEISALALREMQTFPSTPTVVDLLRMPWRFPTLFRYRNATLQHVIDQELTDPRLKAVYSTLWLWIGLPPAQASFPLWATMMGGFIEDGAYYCQGGYQCLADAVAEGFTTAGGELLLSMRATRILAANRQVQGVALEQGQQVQAPIVISNVDARETFETLLVADQVPAYFLGQLREMDLSPSALALYLATDLDARALGAQHEMPLFTSWDHGRAYAEGLAGRVQGIDLLIPTLSDSSLAPSGEHVVIVKAVAPREVGAAPPIDDHRLAERMLELTEQVLPGLRGHVTYVEEAEPRSAPGSTHRYPLRRLGPIYGWANSPRWAGGRRLPQRTPVAGLYLAGQWTQPGHGINTVMQSGVQAAQLVLGVPVGAGGLPPHPSLEAPAATTTTATATVSS